ncbi:MAG: sortase family protein [Candidatus Collierbacteria bacterium GW2011_GWB1_44_6]|uniref:Sortase family protein n=2 Tax=Candidatus Collieribacteriota TaxID=1752725 RepID=A0A0G1MNX2_9BACT|nr:MAG: sortase family protein [Candidatus Collierbacteria bacterium GW2011_GWC2_43_12]KKT73704.1 MAG: sortase family protein [Candidatus Collierbacteria bacterium GW2011_GWB1_44_6]KKT83472.1 MAG: sortase family protein [Microgenomates group bacterium GW2011_GWC1_44_9]
MNTVNKLLALSILLYIVITIGKIFTPVLQQEIGYDLNKVQTFSEANLKVIQPLDKDFGIVIDKIGANARVLKNIDPYDENSYEQAFTEGIAHVDGSALPGQKGNIFLYSHNSSDSFKSSKYNFVFYLLGKLEKGDLITLYYENKPYKYKVQDKQIVVRSAIDYLSDNKTEETLTLMTTWPPGTSLMRSVVHASRLQ